MVCRWRKVRRSTPRRRVCVAARPRRKEGGVGGGLVGRSGGGGDMPRTEHGHAVKHASSPKSPESVRSLPDERFRLNYTAYGNHHIHI